MNSHVVVSLKSFVYFIFGCMVIVEVFVCSRFCSAISLGSRVSSLGRTVSTVPALAMKGKKSGKAPAQPSSRGRWPWAQNDSSYPEPTATAPNKDKDKASGAKGKSKGREVPKARPTVADVSRQAPVTPPIVDDGIPLTPPSPTTTEDTVLTQLSPIQEEDDIPQHGEPFVPAVAVTPDAIRFVAPEIDQPGIHAHAMFNTPQVAPDVVPLGLGIHCPVNVPIMTNFRTVPAPSTPLGLLTPSPRPVEVPTVSTVAASIPDGSVADVAAPPVSTVAAPTDTEIAWESAMRGLAIGDIQGEGPWIIGTDGETGIFIPSAATCASWDHNVTPLTWFKDKWRKHGKTYSQNVCGKSVTKEVNKTLSLEEIQSYILSREANTVTPCSPAEWTPLDSIYEFVVAFKLSCQQPCSHFIWPDTNNSISFTMTLVAAIHYLPPGKCVIIKNGRPFPEGSDLKDFFHGTLPSRTMQMAELGPMPSMGAGASAIEKVFGLPAPLFYCAEIETAKHYPMGPDFLACEKGDKSGGQIVATDGTLPLRAVARVLTNPTRQVFSRSNQKGFMPADVFITHFVFYAVRPQLVQQTMCAGETFRTTISPLDEHRLFVGEALETWNPRLLAAIKATTRTAQAMLERNEAMADEDRAWVTAPMVTGDIPYQWPATVMNLIAVEFQDEQQHDIMQPASFKSPCTELSKLTDYTNAASYETKQWLAMRVQKHNFLVSIGHYKPTKPGKFGYPGMTSSEGIGIDPIVSAGANLMAHANYQLGPGRHDIYLQDVDHPSYIVRLPEKRIRPVLRAFADASSAKLKAMIEDTDSKRRKTIEAKDESHVSRIVNMSFMSSQASGSGSNPAVSTAALCSPATSLETSKAASAPQHVVSPFYQGKPGGWFYKDEDEVWGRYDEWTNNLLQIAYYDSQSEITDTDDPAYNQWPNFLGEGKFRYKRNAKNSYIVDTWQKTQTHSRTLTVREIAFRWSGEQVPTVSTVVDPVPTSPSAAAINAAQAVAVGAYVPIAQYEVGRLRSAPDDNAVIAAIQDTRTARASVLKRPAAAVVVKEEPTAKRAAKSTGPPINHERKTPEYAAYKRQCDNVKKWTRWGLKSQFVFPGDFCNSYKGDYEIPIGLMFSETMKWPLPTNGTATIPQDPIREEALQQELALDMRNRQTELARTAVTAADDARFSYVHIVTKDTLADGTTTDMQQTLINTTLNAGDHRLGNIGELKLTPGRVDKANIGYQMLLKGMHTEAFTRAEEENKLDTLIESGTVLQHRLFQLKRDAKQKVWQYQKDIVKYVPGTPLEDADHVNVGTMATIMANAASQELEGHQNDASAVIGVDLQRTKEWGDTNTLYDTGSALTAATETDASLIDLYVPRLQIEQADEAKMSREWNSALTRLFEELYQIVGEASLGTKFPVIQIEERILYSEEYTTLAAAMPNLGGLLENYTKEFIVTESLGVTYFHKVEGASFADRQWNDALIIRSAPTVSTVAGIAEPEPRRKRRGNGPMSPRQSSSSSSSSSDGSYPGPKR